VGVHVSKKCVALILRFTRQISNAKNIRVVDEEDMLLRNVGKFLPSNTASYPEDRTFVLVDSQNLFYFSDTELIVGIMGGNLGTIHCSKCSSEFRINCPVKVKVKYPRYRPTWPRGIQEVNSPRFIDTRHMKVVRSSPLRTGRLYPQEYPGTHF
jgi:hypothetical protein